MQQQAFRILKSPLPLVPGATQVLFVLGFEVAKPGFEVVMLPCGPLAANPESPVPKA
jgi:hypothetical protein